MNKITIAITFALVGGLAGAVGFSFYSTEAVQEEMVSADEQPLYWVAPMDANYRRDAPGKSPMGMDLVPVYAQEQNLDEGVVSISPTVESNLGVRTGVVEEGVLNSVIRTVGYVQFDEEKIVHMHPRVEGWIEQLNVKAQGEYIQEGEEIYSIYSPVLVNVQEELLLAIERGNQRLIQSAEEKLLALEVPQSFIDRIKREGKAGRTITFFSPKDGVVAELGVREGQFVQPGNPIVSIGVLDEVWVIGEVFERQAALVSVGDVVSMRLDYLPDREWSGVVDFIYPTLDAKTRTVPVRLRFQNPDQELKPNMFAQVTIQSSDEKVVLLVPNEAVIRSGSQDRVVLSMEEGKFKSVGVNIGRRGETHTEVLSGLQAGDNIVLSAHFLLDSESSINSDFMRMGGNSEMSAEQSLNSSNMAMEGHEEMEMLNSDMSDSDDRVWAKGVVERKMNNQMMTVTHDPIPEWEWPTMTMMFEVAEGVDISEIEIGSAIEIEITRQGSSQIISGVRTPE